MEEQLAVDPDYESDPEKNEVNSEDTATYESDDVSHVSRSVLVERQETDGHRRLTPPQTETPSPQTKAPR